MKAVGPALSLALVLLAPAIAEAGNEAHPRTPVLWPEGQCGISVDRDEQPIIHFEYEIPSEDTMLGPEELPDSRTHQFFGFCQQQEYTDLRPNWISVDDVERATLAGVIEPGSVPSSDVLDTNADWGSCFVRITADDDRRPITFAAAEQGFDWDLADVPNGVWGVAGYTFEPPFNLWRSRPGFVKIVDDPDDPAQDLPVASLWGVNAYWWTYSENQFELCIDVLQPATAIFEWAPLAPELVWEEFDRLTIESDGMHELTAGGPALPGPDYSNTQVEGLLRVRVIDAMDREYVVNHSSTTIFERCNGHCGDPPSTPDEPDVSDDGCACAHDEPSGAGPLACLVFALGMVTWRPKRRSRRF